MAIQDLFFGSGSDSDDSTAELEPEPEPESTLVEEGIPPADGSASRQCNLGIQYNYTV
jgi:hypothetical protein